MHNFKNNFLGFETPNENEYRAFYTSDERIPSFFIHFEDGYTGAFPYQFLRPCKIEKHGKKESLTLYAGSFILEIIGIELNSLILKLGENKLRDIFIYDDLEGREIKEIEGKKVIIEKINYSNLDDHLLAKD